jgi:hypothetical protein
MPTNPGVYATEAAALTGHDQAVAYVKELAAEES